jgi:hypothetical protein
MARSPRGTGTRSAFPIIRAKGKAIGVYCPFCDNEHPIGVQGAAPCGTTLILRAEQRTYKGIACALCGKTGGTLVRAADKYKHAIPCSPGKTIYAVPPGMSRSAGFWFRFSPGVHKVLGRYFHRVPVQVGKDGVVSGYTWQTVR